jgi:outer membrane protein OmpA-like peptidoglycan-associated protein
MAPHSRQQGHEQGAASERRVRPGGAAGEQAESLAPATDLGLAWQASGLSHPAAGSLRRSAISALQQARGNDAVQRALGPMAAALLQRQEAPAGPAAAPAADLASFMSQTYSLTNHHPSTGVGLFDAAYNPVAGDLTISLKVCFDFRSGDPADANFVATVGGPAAAAAFTPDQFQWSATEMETWQSRALGDMEGVWSNRHSFHSTRPGFEALPTVRVNVDVVPVPIARRDEAHYVVQVFKWPVEPGRSEFINDPAAGATQSTGEFHESGDNGITDPDESHFVRDTGTRARYGDADTANPGQVFFDVSQSALRPADRAAVQNLGQTLGRADMPPFDVTVTGRASADGQIDANRALSENRAREVSNELVASGAKRQPTIVAAGEDGATATPDFRRAEIEIGNFESDQRTVVHEFGHMIGLDDEYPAADGAASRTVGQEVQHSDLAENLIPGQQPILAHHSENVMSNGEVVRPHHYVTFLEALGQMTSSANQWDVGPAVPSAGPGDFPVPDPDAPVTV